MKPTRLFPLLLLTGCMHRPLTPGQNLLLTAPTSSRPVLRERVYAPKCVFFRDDSPPNDPDNMQCKPTVGQTVTCGNWTSTDGRSWVKTGHNETVYWILYGVPVLFDTKKHCEWYNKHGGVLVAT